MAENPMTEQEHRKIRKGARIYGAVNTFLYRVSGGRLMARAFGHDICLVTMTGAKSGKRRRVPVMYVPYREGIIMVASLGGAPKSPVWFNNLIANPHIEVQHRQRHMKLVARQVFGEEREAVWPVAVEHYPFYADYQKRTDREIPVFICEPEKP